MIPEDFTLRRHYLTEQRFKELQLKETQEIIHAADMIRFKTICTGLVIFAVILFIL